MHGVVLARRRGQEVVFVRDPTVMNSALFELEDDHHLILHGGMRRTAALASYRLRRAFPPLDELKRDLAAELGRLVPEKNLAREARKYVKRIRQRLGAAASTGSYFRRTLLSEPLGLRLRPETERRARDAAARLGVDPDAPIVCLHVRTPGFKADKLGGRIDYTRNASIENHLPACDRLVEEGYTIVRLGDDSMPPLRRTGYVDLATSPEHSGALELHFMLRAHLLVVGESGPNVLGYLTDTPILCVNATDPISSYPIRADGHVLFKRVFDRKTGEPLRLLDLIGEDHLVNLRNALRFRYRENTADEISAAVDEACSWIAGKRTETARQAEFRALATQAAQVQGTMRYVRKWGLDGTFLGDGRLVDFRLEGEL